MSLAEEMLATMPLSDDSATYSADEEPHIVINESRQAIVPNELKTIAVTGDKDIETVTFDCVRYWDGNDLSTFAIYLNYVLPDLTTGTYIPEKITTTDGDEFYHFDWKIKNNITLKSGKISFAVTAVKTKQNENGETVVDKQWGSLPNSDCSIALGLDISNVPSEEESSDVLAQMSAILEKIHSDVDEWVKTSIVQTTGDSENLSMSQKAVSVPLTALTSGELLETNLIDTKTAQVGMVWEDGTITTEGAYLYYFTSDYIKVTPNVAYLFWLSSADGPSRLCVMEYDENKQTLQYRNVVGVSQIEIIVSNSTHYVRVSYRDIVTPSFSSTYGVIAEKAGRVEKVETLLEKTGLMNDSQNMLNPENVLDGLILENGTISTEGAYGNYKTTMRIPVKPNMEYVFRYEGETLSRLVWREYGRDLNPVGRYANTYNINRMVHTTGPNTYYVQLSFSTRYNVMFALSKYADMFYPYGGVDINLIEINRKINSDNGNVLKGKKYCACGDSFTVMSYTGAEGVPEEEYIYKFGKYAGWGITYPFIIGLKNDMEVTNLAVSGMTMAAHDDSTNVFSLTRYTQIPADADYITIKLGINDANYQTPVGTIDDTDNTTFYGAYNLVLAYILENHPFAKVGIIVTNGSAKKYTDATIAIAKKWGIPYLDEVNDHNVPLLHRVDREGVSEEVKNLRLANFRVNETNTHPNTRAHYYEATFVEDFLRRL